MIPGIKEGEGNNNMETLNRWSMEEQELQSFMDSEVLEKKISPTAPMWEATIIGADGKILLKLCVQEPETSRAIFFWENQDNPRDRACFNIPGRNCLKFVRTFVDVRFM